MKTIIKSITGKTLMEIYKADLRGANLREADLYGADLYKANLRGANLREADLRGANLREADLYGADLYKANLRGANLYKADLRGANLYKADLYGADLYGADLYGADLYGADLREADLCGANLRGANLRGANFDNNALWVKQTRILPEGDIIGYKKCQNETIVKLLIPNDAKRSSAFGRKCRAEFAKVLEIYGADSAISKHDSTFVYKKGQVVKPKESFSDSWISECESGIHFFITKEEAENY